MILYKRFAFLIGIFVLFITVLIFRSAGGIQSTKRVWRDAPQVVGLGEWINEEPGTSDAVTHSVTPGNYTSEEVRVPIYGLGEIRGAGKANFKAGTPKPPGSIYTKGVVFSRTLEENITWVEEADFPSYIQAYVYVVDDPTAPLHPIRNKGHEAMSYLTYVIDHYDTLPDVSLFMHAHQYAWHNNEMLNHDAAETVKRLSAERVTREGYMNLRCHWNPGCPAWVHPGVVYLDREKLEEGAMAKAWSELFPDDPIPDVIGTACCAQFAVSKERIRSTPKKKYEHYRAWLLRTELTDYVSGRVFEYLWHKIFADMAVFCPDQRICYCDGYGICIEDEAEFDYWFELMYKRREEQKRFEAWEKKAKKLATLRGEWWVAGQIEEKQLEIPVVDDDTRLSRSVDAYTRELEKMRLRAMERGTDPRVRAKMAGRAWKEGDGY